jgi:hypothetical protein
MTGFVAHLMAGLSLGRLLCVQPSLAFLLALPSLLNLPAGLLPLPLASLLVMPTRVLRLAVSVFFPLASCPFLELEPPRPSVLLRGFQLGVLHLVHLRPHSKAGRCAPDIYHHAYPSMQYLPDMMGSVVH